MRRFGCSSKPAVRLPSSKPDLRFRSHQSKARVATAKLLGIFAVLVLGIVVLVNAALALLFMVLFPSVEGFPPYFFTTNTAVVLLFVLGGAGVESLRMIDGGEHVAKMAGARPAQTGASSDLGRLERRLSNLIGEMALASRMRHPPAAWVLDRDDAINAFAAGWGERDRVVCVTRGALERLTRDELQGVLAHEFAHLKHGDTVLNMRLVGLVWGLQMIHGFGRSLTDADEPHRIPLSAVVGYVLIGVGWLGWLAGRMLQAAVSRQREFHADAAAVEYTRSVAGLAGALRKVSAQVRRAESGRRADQHADALRCASADSVAHLLLHHRASWMRTHPPLHQRLQRLLGRVPEPLPDDVLPAPADEALVPFAATREVPRPADAPSDADRHDAFQPTRNAAREASQRDALHRIERWHGPLELRAACLALLLDRGDSMGWLQWEARIAHPTTTRRVRGDLETLDVDGRMVAFVTLAQRLRSLSASDRASLRRDARALADTASSRLRRFVLLRWLRGAPGRTPAPMQSLVDSLPAAVMSTAALASAVASKDPPAWLGHVRQLLEATHLGAPRLPMWAMRGVLRIAPMERPRLVQAWVKAARKQGLVADDASREALHLAALALDTPAPQLR